MLSKEAKTLKCALPCQFQLIVSERKNGFLFLSVIRNDVEQQQKVTWAKIRMKECCRAAEGAHVFGLVYS